MLNKDICIRHHKEVFDWDNSPKDNALLFNALWKTGQVACPHNGLNFMYSCLEEVPPFCPYALEHLYFQNPE